MALTMSELPLPVQFLAAWTGTWLARRQERLIGYLREENRVLLERLGKVRLTDPERRRLARIGKVVGRKGLGEVASIATPRPTSERRDDEFPDTTRGNASSHRAALRAASDKTLRGATGARTTLRESSAAGQ